MKKLIYKIFSYIGYYNLVVDFNETEVNYSIKALIYSKDRKGKLDADKVKEFNKLIKRAHLEYAREAYYEDKELVTDTPQTNLCYADDKTNVYFVINMDEETKEFKYFMKAIGVIDQEFSEYMKLD